jgi:hypothetical protein
MAKTELSVLATQCLDRRIPAPTTLAREGAAWKRQRNAAKCRVDWRFTTPYACIKPKRLYPSIQLDVHFVSSMPVGAGLVPAQSRATTRVAPTLRLAVDL